MESERLPRSTSFQRIRSRSKAGTSGYDLPPERSYSRAGSANSSYGCGASGVSPMRSPMPAYRSKLVSFPGDENVDPTINGMDIGQPTPLKMREERPDYHTSTADSALRGGAVPHTVPALVPQQQSYRADPYSGQSIKSARGILVDSPKHVSNANRGPMSPISGAADTLCRSTTPPPVGGRTSRAASSSMTPRRRRNRDKRQEAEQNLAFYDDSFVEEFVLCAKEEMSAKEKAAKRATMADTIADDVTTGRSSSKANSILRKEKERLRSSKHHRSSSKRHHHDRKSHRREEMSSGSAESANDDSIASDDDSVEMRSNASRRSDKRHHKHHHHSSKKHRHDAEEEIDPEEEYQALEHARRSASRKTVAAAPASKGKRARSVEDSDMDERSNDMGGDSYTSSSSEDFTDSKGVQRHRRHRRHHHSRSRNTSPTRTTTTTTAAPSILLNPVDMKPAPRRRGARRESVVAFADSHPLVNDKPVRAGRSPSLRSADGDAPVVLGRQRGGKKAVSEEPHELLGRLQSVERPVLLGRSRRAADLMQQEVAHRTNIITAASAVPVPRQRGGKAAAARKATTTTTTTAPVDIFEGLDDNDDNSTPLRQQPSHHAHVLQAASRHNTAAKSAGIKSNDPMAVFFESAFPTPSRFDEMASMAAAPPIGRRKNNGNFPLMLPTTIAKGTKRRA